MKVSRSKTEYMCVNEREGSGTVRLQGEEVKKVQEFKYLGSTVQSNRECGKEVKKRVQAGWNGWRKVSGVLCERKISARIKGKVYRTVVRAAMLYGLETVSLRKRQESELEVAELKMLRFSLGVTRLDRIRNKYIRGTAHVGHMGDKVRETRLRWFGHVQKRETKLRYLRQAKEDAFRNGDRVLYNQARNTLNKEIRVAKRSYAKKLENQFSSNDPASVWKGLKDITIYKTPSPSTEANQQLAEDLNEFYCRFETAGLTPHAPSENLSTQPLIPPATNPPPPALWISEDDVRQILMKQMRRKAPGPDGFTPACLKTCADQLAFIFSQIFNRSLELCEVPACLKRSTIIPIPKKQDNITGPLLDPLQFAYRANRSMDDAVNMGLHFILQHLDKSGTYVRLLFMDFSSAFNTIIPTLLQTELTQLSVPSSICQWITSFLTDRHQLVKLGKFMSNSRTTSTGTPQGCVLSPLLFSLYTNDCTSTDPSVKLLNFTDDTTVIGLIQGGDESAYRQEIEQLAAWCSLNNLELSTLKTVEMIVDFRRNTPALPRLTIMNSTVPTVESFRFLGTTISQDLKTIAHFSKDIAMLQSKVHGLDLFIPDTPVPMGVTDRARRTLPSGLEIQKSSIPDAGLGVFNKGETVPVGAHFGPFKGDLVEKEEAMNSGYFWVTNEAYERCE
ncbi:hypothetical protein QTP70_011245 [Hemibagrus guttatus]|uniref:Reverse transcriptase domain-containing protein n=1 Tax=Hemibagrus guttatus TaxID=175788 RepID=A0AAE0UH95_9TELE|nr:hypothetical protein QTP70_011245 [Hemibagrus guttatus]